MYYPPKQKRLNNLWAIIFISTVKKRITESIERKVELKLPVKLSFGISLLASSKLLEDVLAVYQKLAMSYREILKILPLIHCQYSGGNLKIYYKFKGFLFWKCGKQVYNASSEEERRTKVSVLIQLLCDSQYSQYMNCHPRRIFEINWNLYSIQMGMDHAREKWRHQ